MQGDYQICSSEDGLVDDVSPFARKPEAGSVQAGEFWLSKIHAKLRKLESLGLRPHPYLLENKTTMERWVRGGGEGESFSPAMTRQTYL